MPAPEIKGPSTEDLALIALAQQRLANTFGGRWAEKAANVGRHALTVETPSSDEETTVISQRQLVEGASENTQRLVELGLLAAGPIRDRSPYFVK
ncbi:MAG: hypothetical protein JWN75_1124 [Candidatus Saccharibacteria bacterium]|nr:hypothetical protein [Candidatus Saccharibacteria bacterium]